MIEYIGKPAMLEQLAEEATELAHAALKLARIYRAENPTPVTAEQAAASVQEEYTDVIQCAEELGLEVDEDQIIRKQKRFRERLWTTDGAGIPIKTADFPDCKTCVHFVDSYFSYPENITLHQLMVEGEAKYARYHAAHCDMNRLFNHCCPYYREAKEDKA